MLFRSKQMFDILADGAQNGIYNLDYLADAVKEFGIRVKDESDTTKEAFDSLGLKSSEMSSMFAEGGESAQKAFSKTMDALAKIEDPVKRNTVGVELFGTKFEDLEYEAILSLANVEGAFDETANAMEKIDNVKYDSVGEAITGIGRIITAELFLPLQDKIMPGINKFAQDFKNNMTGIIHFMKSLFSGDEEQLVNLLEKLGLSSSQVQAIINAINLIQKYLSLAGQQIASFFQEKGAEIMAFWNQYGPQIMQAVQNVANGILAVIQFVMPLVLFIIKSVWTNIKGVISGALNIIMGLIKVFTGLFTADWTLMWEGVKQLFSGAVQFIWNLINLMFLGKVLSLFKSFVTGGLSLLRGLWRDIVFDVKKFVQGILASFKSFKDSAIGTFNFFRSTGLGIFNSFRGSMQLIVEGLKNAVLRIFTNLYTGGNRIFNNILSAGRTAFNNLKSAITSPIETAKKTILGIIEAIKDAFKKMKIEIPKPKIPKVSVSMKEGFAGIPYPDFDVQWLASGGLVPPNSPRLVGMGDAKVPEAAVPLSDKVLGTIGKMIAATMPEKKNTEQVKRPAVLQVVFPDKREIAEFVVDDITELQEFNKFVIKTFEGR